MLIGSQWICFFLFPLCMAVLNCGTVTRTKWTYIFRNQSLCFTNEYIRLRLMQQVGSSTFNSGQICMCEIRLSKEVLIVILGKLREIAEDDPHLPTVYCGAQFVSNWQQRHGFIFLISIGNLFAFIFFLVLLRGVTSYAGAVGATNTKSGTK